MTSSDDTVPPGRGDIKKDIKQRMLSKQRRRRWGTRVGGYILIAIFFGILLVPTAVDYLDHEEPQSEIKQPVISDESEKDRWEFYEDKAGLWRWRRRESTGEIVGAASKGYKSEGAAVANAKRHGFEEQM